MLDYHIHTPLCGHAKGRPAAMVQAAVARGLEEVAFLDHLTLAPLPGNHSMTAKDVPFYLNTLRELAAAWEGRIRVLAGLEIDYHPDITNEIHRITDTFDLDLVGGSVHFTRGVNIASRQAREAWPPDTAALYHSYLDDMEALVAAGFCDVICHLDLMEKFAPVLSDRERRDIADHMDHLLRAIAQKDLTVEVNGSGLDQPVGRPYPAFDLLQACHARGIAVTLASDAHDPASVGAYTETLLHLIRRAGYDKIACFHRRRRRFLSLTP